MHKEFQKRYSTWREDLGRYETWEETVERYKPARTQTTEKKTVVATYPEVLDEAERALSLQERNRARSARLAAVKEVRKTGKVALVKHR